MQVATPAGALAGPSWKKAYWPLRLVVVARVVWVESWYRVTSVPATGRPAESITVPVMNPKFTGGTTTDWMGGVTITKTGSAQLPAPVGITMVSEQVLV